MSNCYDVVFIGLNLSYSMADGIGENTASYLLFKLLENSSDVTWTIFGIVSSKCYRWLGFRDGQIHSKTKGPQGSLLPFDVLLTTYDVALMDQDFLSQIPWHYAIIDEAQRLKNPSSVLYNILKECFLMPRRLLMTGTPIQNNLTELWALMHFCMPSVFGTHEQFLSTFKEAGDPTSDSFGFRDLSDSLSCFLYVLRAITFAFNFNLDAAEVKRQLKNLKCIMTAFMLRRTKSKLIECGNLVLPPLTEITVMAPLVSLQKSLLISPINSASCQVIQLRKACSHPYLFPGIEPEPFEEGEHLVQVSLLSVVYVASGKLLILDQLLQKLHDSGHRVLLFAQMTHTLDILQDFLELRKYSYERLDGSVRAEERFAAIKVIFYEQDWNPQVDKQALQRAHRIGQINHVLSINLVTMCSVEEVVMRRAERKLQLSHNVVGDDIVQQKGKETAGVETMDLKSIIFGLHMFDPSEISTGKSDELNMPELNAMTAKVIAMRDDQRLGEIDRKYVVNRIDQIDAVIGGNSAFADYDHGLDEASYQSWVRKFEEASQSSGNPVLDLGHRRNLPEDKHLKLEAARKKAEEKKLSKGIPWIPFIVC
ncbi:hypothetical protein GH714_011848 [Hevea brasiliensis]|uniref:Helicase ATP-binding domain-containing protein n=1 Tax=Hevea brasiliensis TaxID=3981 RepID=A0A6A6MYN9_HEVBR|nr:hypothetical protein GH714_011848 [Hevea brasiliensis]